MMSSGVDLGFAEDQDEHLLTSRFFPSKIGGKPAWLDLSQNIPTAKDLECDYCNDPCIFLCQVYAAGSKIHSFHRTIFVFVCKNEKCCSINQAGNIKIFRNQLPINNDFYPPTPPDENSTIILNPDIKLCKVCHCNGPLICGKCKKISYCSQHHQKLDWKNHKKFCTKSDDEIQESEILFPEYEIVIDREEEEDERVDSSESRRMKEYEEMVKELEANKSHDIPEGDFNELSESKEDKTFGKFKKIIEKNPSQILRYKRHGEPLWISKIGILKQSDVPNCSSCNGRRTFEFQIMPQMLNYLKNYELDWGIIAVYTCENECKVNGKYVREFCCKQDVQKGDDDIESLCEEKFEEMTIEKVEKKPQKATKEKSVKKPPKKVENAFEESENWE